MNKLDFEFCGLPTYYEPVSKEFKPMNYHARCSEYPFSHLVLNMWSYNEFRLGKSHCVWCGMKEYWIILQKSDENEAMI